MKEIRVDFNRRDSEGRVLTSSARLEGANVGERVRIFQQGEPEKFIATVASISSSGKVVLDVRWAPISQPWTVSTSSGYRIATPAPRPRFSRKPLSAGVSA